MNAEVYREIDKDAFVDYGSTPLKHTLYTGSDDLFHYFVWSSGKSGGKWKLKKTKMTLGCEFPLADKTESPLITDSQGVVYPYKCFQDA